MRRKTYNVFQGIDVTTHEKKIYTFNLCSIDKCEEFMQLAKTFQSEQKKECRFIDNPKHFFNNGGGVDA